MKKILQKEASVLRNISKIVPLQNIASSKIQNIIKEMKKALISQEDGVAIAAPQIGYSLRIFIISKKVFEMNKIAEKGFDKSKLFMPDLVFINPEIKKLSREKKIVEEGCLSVRYLYGKVSRSHKATVEAYDERGKKFSRGGTGLMAQIFQHEIDHLDGTLFIDKATNLKEMPPEKVTKKNKTNE